MRDVVKTGAATAEQLDRAFEIIRDSFDAFVDRTRGLPYTKETMQEWLDELERDLRKRTDAHVHIGYNPVDFVLTITMGKIDEHGNEMTVEFTVNLRGW